MLLRMLSWKFRIKGLFKMSKYRIRYIPKKTLILKNLIFYDLHLINDVWFGNKKKIKKYLSWVLN